MVTNEKGGICYGFGPFRVDLGERLLLRRDRVVPLAPKLFETLVILVTNNGRLMGKDDLLQRLWPDSFADESSLAQNIFQLRRVLRDTTKEEYIETIPRRGYRFVANVREINDRSGTSQYSAGEASLLEEDPRPIKVKSVVVLPFRSLGPESGENFLGLGMTDATIIKLVELKELVVMPTSVVFKYAGKKNDPITIGKELNVDAVLDGTVQRSEGRIRVTVQLIRISDSRTLWSGKFDELVDDIFAVQDSISEQVATAFTVNTSGHERTQLRKRYTESIEAYQTYVMGLFFWSKDTKEGLEQAIPYFLQAIEKDSSYALAYASLADCYFLLADRQCEDLPLESAYQRIESAASKALEIDPLLAEAYTALAVVKIKRDRDAVAAATLFRQAVNANPNCAVAHLRYTWFLAAMGSLDEALDEIRKAQCLDPLSPATNAGLGGILYFSRRWDEAISFCQRALIIQPALVSALLWTGRCDLQKGMPEKAIEQFRQAIEVSEENTEALGLLAYALATIGRVDEAREILSRLLAPNKSRRVRSFHVALISAALGETEVAFEWLEKPYFNWTERLRILRYDPLMDILRGDSRFDRVLLNSLPQSVVLAVD